MRALSSSGCGMAATLAGESALRYLHSEAVTRRSSPTAPSSISPTARAASTPRARSARGWPTRRPPSRSTASCATSACRCPTARTCASCASATRRRCRCCATRRRTCWPRPSSTSGPAPRSRSGPRSRTASTTTSSSPSRPARPTSRASRTRCARSSSAARTPIERIVTTREEAVARFAPRARPYKVELAEGLPEGEEVTFYEQDGFVDLCRGPHLQTTKPIQAFKLTSLAGAYWRGDSRQADADAHLRHGLLRPGRARRAPRAASRRRGGATTAGSAASSTSSTSATTSPGSPFWHPRGMVLFNELGRLWRELNASRGYRGGAHADPLRHRALEALRALGQLPRQDVPDRAGRGPAVRPQADELPRATSRSTTTARHSYRDLPLRLAEQGLVHRNEDSGVDARPPARAPHHAGRRAHLLPLGSGRGRGRRLPRARARDLRHVRPRRPRRALDAPGEAARQRGGVGSHGGRAAPRRSRRPAGTTS